MIRVTIDLWPGGFEEGKKTLHVIDIWNDGVTTRLDRRFGSYGYRISRKVSKSGLVSWLREGRVERFPRAAKNSVHLLRDVLNNAYGGE